MLNFRRYSTADHEDIWRIHLLVIAAAGVEPTHQHYHDIFHIHENYLDCGGDFFVGTGLNGVVLAMGGLKKLDEETAEIKRLRVHPDYQQRGFGQALLERLEERALELGFNHIYLDALTNQLGAKKMFMNNGYHHRGASVIDGFWINVYEKSLVPST
ncbi:GNAT family N-acetyltransferase [Paenibacillus baekrokdamisoli]|uniref:GNAT family N-acetyltransferase n=1 Tax=Paenibacillus baekrokdamisoli TaxID=1712516 RepID=A0A3G9JLE1_9BACL|nr:GNAT family N-acetyltransferase [Paenibacillus baekrokdamisoli]MBB3068887.1 GNAT superfamily N-acetyltransferase [Paenibacillus baekrokdamisoli]BBH23714.1 GNAT family N-acetyltransferase [Paenibacillus baekrokdamisoli]